MIRCSCAELPAAFDVDEAAASWLGWLRDERTGNWKELKSCPSCGALFAVDVWDKYQHQVVVRVTDIAVWERTANDVSVRKALLLSSRGGLQDGDCAWAACHQRRVRGVAYCIDHLSDGGARR